MLLFRSGLPLPYTKKGFPMQTSIRYFLVGLVFIAAAAQAHAQQFRVGFGKRDITPQKPMPMWGYGDRHDLLSTGARDPLYAKAVVIETGEDKLAIVGLDLGRSPMTDMMNRIRKAVADQSGVNYILMSGSHTHHGPVLELADEEGKGKGKFDDGVAYLENLEGLLVDAINEAAANVQDARIGWASDDIDMNRNRHTDIEPKPRDTELNVLRFDNTSGEPIAVVVNYAAHPTMSPGEDLRFSADYPGQMMAAVEAAMNTNCVFMQGAAGDMSCKTTESTQGIEAFGKALGQEVMKLANGIKTAVPEKPSIAGRDQDFPLQPRVDLTNPLLQNLLKQAFFPELANRALDELGEGVITPHLTTVFLNGNLGLVGASGEFFCNHANHLKERSRVKTLFFGYCNGHHMYFPTIEAASEGGYGADATVSWVPLGTGEMMMNEALINLYLFQDKFDNPFEKIMRDRQK